MSQLLDKLIEIFVMYFHQALIFEKREVAGTHDKYNLQD